MNGEKKMIWIQIVVTVVKHYFSSDLKGMTN
jgi:hypothetical protein